MRTRFWSRRRRNDNDEEVGDDDRSYSHNNSNNSDGRGEATDNSNNDAVVISESELLFSMESFAAVVAPVTITMVLSALAVVFINTEETIAAGEAAYAKVYQIFDVGGSNANNDSPEEKSSVLETLGLSLVNTIVIVTTICAMTFVVVLCYKYKFTKLLYAYMVLVTAALLGYFTTNMVLVAISIYPWMGHIDKLSLAIIMYNYAAVGTVAIFLPRGIPTKITQGYLIASSVCLAWQISYFNAWMAWTLLVMLAFYDLFAVLTPCGPLRALAKLISKDGAQALPGLLYEASLPNGVRKHSGRRRRTTATTARGDSNPDVNEHETESTGPPENNAEPGIESRPLPEVTESTPSSLAESISSSLTQRQQQSGGTSLTEQLTQREGIESSTSSQGETATRSFEISIGGNSFDPSSQGNVPLALARMYKLPVLDTRGILLQQRGSMDDGSSPIIGEEVHGNNTNEIERNDTGQSRSFGYTGAEIRSMQWTSQQLATEVTCIFPPRGGRIVRARTRDQKYDAGTAYVVYDRHGNEQRKFVVGPEGNVMEVVRREESSPSSENNDDDANDNTIKLGLGDFIFYSVLVSKAAQYSFMAFASCSVVVLGGLAATLVLLSISGKALPALPISVFLGVVTFLWTRTFLQPWVATLMPLSIYV